VKGESPAPGEYRRHPAKLKVSGLHTMHKVFDDIWRVYPENMLKNRTWHWWWWLHFFENPDNPQYPRQLMILWGTRNCRKVRVNDYHWEPTIPMEIESQRAGFESMVASWYYDGSTMHDPFFIDHGKTETTWGEHSGQIRMNGEKGSYSYGGSSANFWLKVDTKDVAIALSMGKWMDELAELIPSGRNFVGKMGYSMLKYRGLSSVGRIRIGQSETEVDGRSYFQKVRISSITPCWYWGTVQWDNGGYLQYFLPHVGLPMLRQTISHESLMDWGEKMVSKTLNFYNPNEGRELLMENVTITKRYENDLPVFTVTASSKDAELSIEMATYARCCWNIAQPLVGPYWHGIFYNEYPARVTQFKLKTNSVTADDDAFGKSYCNCEHTWGTV